MIPLTSEIVLRETESFFNRLMEKAMFDPVFSKAYSNVFEKGIKICSVTVVGCGGTGSWLMPKLVKTLNDAKRKNLIHDNFKFVMIDADTVEDKNLVRQNFIAQDVGKNKAQVMMERYDPHLNFKHLSVFIDKYISTEEQIYSRKEKDRGFFIPASQVNEILDLGDSGSKDIHIVFNLVDNNMARQAVHSLSEWGNRGFGSIYIADTGNDMYNGQCHMTCYKSKNAILGGRIPSEFLAANICKTQGFFSANPEAEEAIDDVSLYSCAEADVDINNQDQMLVANDFAATICHNWFISLLMSHMSDSFNPPIMYSDFICGLRTNASTLSKFTNENMIKAYMLYGFLTGKIHLEGDGMHFNEEGSHFESCFLNKLSNVGYIDNNLEEEGHKNLKIFFGIKYSRVSTTGLEKANKILGIIKAYLKDIVENPGEYERLEFNAFTSSELSLVTHPRLKKVWGENYGKSDSGAPTLMRQLTSIISIIVNTYAALGHDPRVKNQDLAFIFALTHDILEEVLSISIAKKSI